MDTSNWLALIGILVSCTISGFAIWFSRKANRTAHDAFRYTTGMVWQLLSYESKAKTAGHGIAIPLGGTIYFGLSALGTMPVREIKVTFSHDPNHLMTHPYQFFGYDPGKDEQFVISSGLKTLQFFEIKEVEDAHVLIEWLDVAGERRKQKISLADIKQIDVDFDPPEHLKPSET